LIEIGNEGHWKISPNPANNSFSNVISGVPLNNITLRIYNTAGVCLKTESVRQQQITVATTDLAIGVYIIVLQSGNLNVRQKLVVQR
ncbi:MAG: T9SS type A sorting domain-containing protein, partial [Chitinophagaceae bacterium]|nr:T9SS type A sorting domain-containing protein [Chitinophagaceae bacterium]